MMNQDEGGQTQLTVNTERNGDLSCDEDLPPCSPSPTLPQAGRRRFRRLQIKSAIPLLPELDSRRGTPQKPSPGTKGTPIQVYCNHFPVKVAKDKILYQYDALVEKVSAQRPQLWEEAMSRDQRRRFVQQLSEQKSFDFIYWSVLVVFLSRCYSSPSFLGMMRANVSIRLN